MRRIRISAAAIIAAGAACGQPFPNTIPTSQIQPDLGSAISNDSQPVLSSLTDVAVIGDVNDDGVVDFAAAGVGDAEDTWVFFGRRDGLPANLVTSTIDATSGFRLMYTANSGKTGDRNGIGDINNDGIADFAVAHEDRTDDRVVTVIYGRTTFSDIDLENLSAEDGFHINDSLVYPSDAGKIGVDPVGDINADGAADFLIRSWEADSESDFSGTSIGAGFVVFGRGSDFPATIDLTALDGSNGFTLPGTPDGLRFAVSGGGAGDFNDDGVADLIIGQPGILNDNETAGRAYVVFGRQMGFPTSVSVAALDGTDGLALIPFGNEITNFGVSVAGGGDFNGDEIDDVLIGAPTSDPFDDESNRGVTVVAAGSSTNPATLILDLTPPAMAQGKGTNRFFPFYGVAGEELGLRVVLGDVTQDGLADAFAATPTGAAAQGRIYGLLGRANPDRRALRADVTITNDVGAFPAQLGLTGLAVGDVTGDGVHDLLMSGSTLMQDSMGNGTVYILNGVDGDLVFQGGFEGDEPARAL